MRAQLTNTLSLSVYPTIYQVAVWSSLLTIHYAKLSKASNTVVFLNSEILKTQKTQKKNIRLPIRKSHLFLSCVRTTDIVRISNDYRLLSIWFI